MLLRWLNKFRTRLALLVIAAVAPAFGLIAYTAWEQRQQAYRDALATQTRLGKGTEKSYGRLVSETRLLLFSVTRLPEVKAQDRAACNRHLAQLRQEFPHYANIGVAGLTGEVFCSAVPLTQKVNIAGRPYFRDAVATRSFAIGNYQFGRIAGKPTVNFGYPVLGANGQVQAVAFAALDFDWIKDSFSEARLPAGASLTLVSHDGIVLARYPDPEQWTGKAYPAMALLQSQLGLSGSASGEHQDQSGQSRFYLFSTLNAGSPALRAYLSVEIPKQAVFAEAGRIFIRNALELALMTAVVIAVAWVAGNALVMRRVTALVETARRFASGDLKARSQMEYDGGELGELARSFDEMADSAGKLVERYRQAQEDLDLAHERLRAIIEAAPLAIYTTDLIEGVVTSWNPAAERIFGWKAQEVIGRPLPTVSGERRAEAKELLARATRGEHLVGVEVERVRRDGTPINLSLSIAPLYAMGGKVSGRLVIAEDITEKKRTEQELARSLSLLKATLDATADGILVVDDQGKIVTYNSKFMDMWRIPKAVLTSCDDSEALGFVMSQLKDPEAFVEKVKDLYSHSEAESYDILEFKDGRVFERYSQPQWVAGKIVGRVWSFSDVTERKVAEERLAYLAEHDTLTGLPNRNLFRDRLSHAMARAARSEKLVALMLLDLDNFKYANDTLGHKAGDLVLQEVAKRLTGCLREVDTVARLGGDEFTVILETVTHIDQVKLVAEKILHVLSRPITVEGSDVFVTASIGITLYPLDVEDMDTMLKQADAAMYYAKAQGRNNYQFYAAKMSEQASERLSIESAIRHALEREELLLHYQPQVELETGCIVGVEALVRWQHPERGLVLPGEFIPAAEESGLIVPIGEFVIKTACAQAKAWQRAGLPPLTVAVNLSARQFHQRYLAHMIHLALEHSGLDPGWLELEITESMVMKNFQEAIQILEELKRTGLKIAIDDFGTGYSSLSYLKRFPVDKLKIDQSFVHDITTDPDDAAIVTAIIAMAKSLGLQVIAEGVETEEQRRFLLAQGCGEAQGYYFARPLPEEAVTALLRENADRFRAKSGKTAPKSHGSQSSPPSFTP